MDKKDKIYWIGIDGFLVLAYFLFFGTVLFAFITRNNFLMQWGFPGLLFGITTFIFINYCMKVKGFIKLSQENAALRKEKMAELAKMEEAEQKAEQEADPEHKE
jgi:hypothetical protein